jgi:hypothetical protein
MQKTGMLSSICVVCKFNSLFFSQTICKFRNQNLNHVTILVNGILGQK